jgi:hypothetical protein
MAVLDAPLMLGHRDSVVNGKKRYMLKNRQHQQAPYAQSVSCSSDNSNAMARISIVHALNSRLIGILKVLASFTSVVRRKSFSPLSITPVKDRARPLW